MMMHAEKIYYFEKKGNINFENVIDIVAEYLVSDSSIEDIVIFAANLGSVMKLHDKLKERPVKITVATYPYGREFIRRSADSEEPITIIPEVTQKDAKEKIIEKGMNYVQGGLPFEPIISCTGDHLMEMIVSSYDTISQGLVLCINATLMAAENGYVQKDKKIIALTGDTAIVVTPSIKRDMFDGDFRIHKILCKPY